MKTEIETIADGIDGSSGETLSTAWDIELKRRVLEIKEGRVEGIPVEEVFARLGAKYS